MKNSEASTLQQYSSVVDIIADEHSDQSRVSYSKKLSPIPAMTEPQMHPYRVIKRYGNINVPKTLEDGIPGVFQVL